MRLAGPARRIARAVIASLTILAGLVAGSTAAQAPTRYLAAPHIDRPGEARIAAKGAALAEYALSPELAVELEGAIPLEIATRAAVQPKFPFAPGRMLYGWHLRPGLFCDLMRNRGLGSSTACLRDTNLDGRFDEAVRYDFNSARADLVFITDKGKVRGGKFKSAIPLPQPVAYRPVANPAMPEARVKLLWRYRTRDDAGAEIKAVELMVTDGSNFTGTEILSEQIAMVTPGERSIDLAYYGLQLTISGLTAEGQLAYTARPIEGAHTIGFVFRGYLLHILMI